MQRATTTGGLWFCHDSFLGVEKTNCVIGIERGEKADVKLCVVIKEVKKNHQRSRPRGKS